MNNPRVDYQYPYPGALGNNVQRPCMPQLYSYEPMYKQIKREAIRKAAQKWRDNKQEKLNKLEIENSEMRKELYELSFQFKKEKIESNLLATELKFFQSLLSAIVQHGLLLKQEQN